MIGGNCGFQTDYRSVDSIAQLCGVLKAASFFLIVLCVFCKNSV